MKITADEFYGMPINETFLPLILAFVVNEINQAPVDTRTRLRTYDQIAAALKERVKERREPEKEEYHE